MKTALVILVLVFLTIACGGSGKPTVRETVTVGMPTAGATQTEVAIATSTPESCQTALRKLTATDRTSGDLNLKSTIDYEISWLIFNKAYMVEILPGQIDPTTQLPIKSFYLKKAESEGWFHEQGCLQSDLCLMKIQFLASKEVQYDFSHGEGRPTGCPSS